MRRGPHVRGSRRSGGGSALLRSKGAAWRQRTFNKKPDWNTAWIITDSCKRLGPHVSNALSEEILSLSFCCCFWLCCVVCEDPLEEERATHCSIPAWRIPWTEDSCLEDSMDRGFLPGGFHGQEPTGYSAWGSRARHD